MRNPQRSRLDLVYALLLAVTVVAGCVSRHGLAPGAKRDAIVALKEGMTYEQVVAIVGKPFDHVVLTYSRELGLLARYPMLWVHLKEGRLTYVNAKIYDVGGYDHVVDVSAGNPLFEEIFGR